MKKNIATAPMVDKAPAEKGGLSCHHYWVIEKAKGPTSRGKCKYCSSMKDFSNFIPDLRWDAGVFNKPGSGLPVLDEINRENVSAN